MRKLKSNEITLNSSSGHKQISLEPITIFVGPNNSGKSLILNEIYSLLKESNVSFKGKILHKLYFRPLPIYEAQQKVDFIFKDIKPESKSGEKLISFERSSYNFSISEKDVFYALTLEGEPPSKNIKFHSSLYRVAFLYQNSLQKLNGLERLNLCNPQGAGNYNDEAKLPFQKMHRDVGIRNKIRKIIYEAIEKYVLIDHSESGKLKIKLSPDDPSLQNIDELSVGQETINFLKKSKFIDEYSDGIRTFVGMIINIFADDPKALLIDEPEAFLHPS